MPLTQVTRKRARPARSPCSGRRKPFKPKVIYFDLVDDITKPGGSVQVIHGFRYDGLLVSQSHCRLPTGAWSGGGSFYAHHEKLEHVGTSHRQMLFSSGGTYHPRGCTPAPTAVPTMPKPDVAAAFADSDQYGLSGYNKTRPGNSVADLGVASSETIADGLPSVPLGLGGLFPNGTDSRGFPRGLPFSSIPGRLRALLGDFQKLARVLGGQYLNVVFGWLPFLRDLRKLFAAMQNMQAMIDKLIRENGKVIHRKALLLNEKDVTQTRTNYATAFVNVYGSPPNWFPGSTEYTVTTRTLKKVWYSAAYRYWIPDTDSMVWRAKAVVALLGGLPTPGVVWAAMPWTWLTDWFGDLSDLFDSLSPNAVDGLVQLYGYTMTHSTTEKEWRCHVTQPPVKFTTDPSLGTSGTAGCDFTFRSTSLVEKKVRGGGYNPFGTNLKVPGDLSAGQLAILAALGLSRG